MIVRVLLDAALQLAGAGHRLLRLLGQFEGRARRRDLGMVGLGCRDLRQRLMRLVELAARGQGADEAAQRLPLLRLLLQDL